MCFLISQLGNRFKGTCLDAQLTTTQELTNPPRIKSLQPHTVTRERHSAQDSEFLLVF